METLEYPSKGFADAAKKLMDEKEEFTVVVAKNAKRKKRALLRTLPTYLTGRDHRNRFRIMTDAFYLTDFDSSFLLAIFERRYEMRYEDKGDLIIYLKPIIYE